MLLSALPTIDEEDFSFILLIFILNTVGVVNDYMFDGN